MCLFTNQQIQESKSNYKKIHQQTDLYIYEIPKSEYFMDNIWYLPEQLIPFFNSKKLLFSILFQ